MANKPEAKTQQDKASLLPLTEKQISVLLIAAIIVLAFTIRLYGLMDTGLTWDEPTTVNAGISYVTALTHFDFQSGAWAMNYEHPPIGKYIYGIAIWLFNSSSTNYNGYVIARLMSVIMGVATCLLTYLIGKEYFNNETGAISALTLALIPVFVAQTQIAALDSPIAFFFTLTMYLFMLALRKNSARYYVAAAVSLGLLIGVKLNGLLILPILAILYLIYRREYLKTHKPGSKRMEKGKAKKGQQDRKNPTLELIKAYVPPMAFAGFCLIVVLTIFLLWPWTWFSIADHLTKTLDHWTYIPTEFFLGSDAQPPVYYYIVYFLVTTPLLLLIPMAIGIYAAARSRDVFKYAILLWLIVPFAYSFSSFKQDGMRYLLMIYPAMAILIGYGLYRIAALASGLNVPTVLKKAALPVLCAATIVYLVICLASVSPYYLDYYNSLSGGYQHIHDDRTLVFGWWGEGIYNAEHYVGQVGNKSTTAFVMTMPQDATYQLYGLQPSFIQVAVTNQSSWDYMMKLLHPDAPGSQSAMWRKTDPSFKPDYLITNFNAEEYYNVSVDETHFKLVYTSNVQGVPIAKAYKVL